MSLRESVIIKTVNMTIPGELVVGPDGLPTLNMPNLETYRPWSFPASWIVTSSTCGPLYSAWDLIWNLIEELAVAQREAEAEDRDRAQQREIDNRTAQEIDERRAEP